MNNNLPIPQTIAILAHPKLPEALTALADVQTCLLPFGAKLVGGSLEDESLRQRVRDGEFDCLIALGGDGTMLRAGHLCAVSDIPLLGINMGRFGFLAELRPREWCSSLPLLMNGQYRLEARMMLKAETTLADGSLKSWDVVNDVVVCRGKFVRPVQLSVTVDGHFLAEFIADGLIAATATGSTAYALAAGGPILPPELRNILLMPVAPHLSIDRAIVLSEGAVVNISVLAAYEAVASMDGHDPLVIKPGTVVKIFSHPKSLKMIRFQDPGYFYRNIRMYMEHNPLIKET